MLYKPIVSTDAQRTLLCPLLLAIQNYLRYLNALLATGTYYYMYGLTCISICAQLFPKGKLGKTTCRLKTDKDCLHDGNCCCHNRAINYYTEAKGLRQQHPAWKTLSCKIFPKKY